MSHLDHYLKAIMQDVTITNAQLLFANRDLKGATSKNGLTAVKLHRIRRVLANESEPVALEWGKLDGFFAVCDEGGAPKVQSKNGQPLEWNFSGSPVYEYERADARLKALGEFDAGTISFAVPRLTDTDLALIECERDIGDTLALFSEHAPIPITNDHEGEEP